jgi:hypothetical protein
MIQAFLKLTEGGGRGGGPDALLPHLQLTPDPVLLLEGGGGLAQERGSQGTAECHPSLSSVAIGCFRLGNSQEKQLIVRQPKVKSRNWFRTFVMSPSPPHQQEVEGENSKARAGPPRNCPALGVLGLVCPRGQSLPDL